MLWGNNDNATGNNKPKFQMAISYVAPYSNGTGNSANVVGVSATEEANTSGQGPKVTHAGWVVWNYGTGPVSGFTVTAPGRGYSNGDFVTFTGGGGASANAMAVTNANGSIVSVTLNSGGSRYNAAPTAVFANTLNTSTAAITVSVGGRAGRFQHETLVAMGSIASDDAGDNTAFPGV